MRPARSHISVEVSRETKRLLDRASRARGLPKKELVEAAILHHLRAVDGLPPHAHVSTRIVLRGEAAKMVAGVLAKPPKPAPAMRELMAGKDVGDPPSG